MAEKLNPGNGEDKKLKGKMEEESSTMNPKPESKNQSLSRAQGKRPMVDDEPPSREFAFKLLKGPYGEGSSSGSGSCSDSGPRTAVNLVGSPKPPKPLPNHDDDIRNLYCRFCDRRFSNSQALGGHQNAHRSERALLREPETYRYGYGGTGVGGLGHSLLGGGCTGSLNYNPYLSFLFQMPSTTTPPPSTLHPPHQCRGNGVMGGHLTNHVSSLGSWPSSLHGTMGNNVGGRISNSSSSSYRFGMMTSSSWGSGRTGVLDMLNHNRNAELPSLVESVANGSGMRHQLRVIRPRIGGVNGNGDDDGVDVGVDVASSSGSGNNNDDNNNNNNSNGNPSGSTPNGSSDDDEEQLDLNLKL